MQDQFTFTHHHVRCACQEREAYNERVFTDPSDPNTAVTTSSHGPRCGDGHCILCAHQIYWFARVKSHICFFFACLRLIFLIRCATDLAPRLGGNASALGNAGALAAVGAVPHSVGVTQAEASASMWRDGGARSAAHAALSAVSITLRT